MAARIAGIVAIACTLAAASGSEEKIRHLQTTHAAACETRVHTLQEEVNKYKAELAAVRKGAFSKEAALKEEQDVLKEERDGGFASAIQDIVAAAKGQRKIPRNAAKCANSGQESQVVGTLDCGPKSQRCPDDLSAAEFLWVGAVGVPRCSSFASKFALAGETNSVKRCRDNHCETHFLPKGQSGVVTKARVVHPDKTNRRVGGLALKRIAPCGTTVTADGKTAMHCDAVFKVGVCIQCPEPMFERHQERLATKDELKNFVQKCAQKAFDTTGVLHPSFECDRRDKKSFAEFLKIF